MNKTKDSQPMEASLKDSSSKTQQADSPEALRRNFLKKFGKYAVSTPVVTFTLMSSYSSKAIASGGGPTENGPP